MSKFKETIFIGCKYSSLCIWGWGCVIYEYWKKGLTEDNGKFFCGTFLKMSFNYTIIHNILLLKQHCSLCLDISSQQVPDSCLMNAYLMLCFAVHTVMLPSNGFKWEIKHFVSLVVTMTT